MSWSLSSPVEWISFSNDNVISPAPFEVIVDLVQLEIGEHNTSISLISGEEKINIPIQIKVEPLNLKMIRSRRDSEFVYAISQSNQPNNNQAFLLEIDSRNEEIARVVSLGKSVGDFTVHHPENAVYLANWDDAELIAVDLNSFKVRKTFTFVDPLEPDENIGKVWKVSAGAEGRLVIEGIDGHRNISIFDTDSGEFLDTVRGDTGDGVFDPEGKYYYHGDYASRASITKYVHRGDQLVEVRDLSPENPRDWSGTNILISADGSRISWASTIYNVNFQSIWRIGDIIYSLSTDGRFAFAREFIYDAVEKRVVLGMPARNEVSAFNPHSEKLITQGGQQIIFYQISSEGAHQLPPPVLSVAVEEATTAKLMWTDDSLEMAFHLQMRIKGQDEWEDVKVDIEKNQKEFEVSRLNESTIYEFRIRATTPDLTSAWSNVANVETGYRPPFRPYLSRVSKLNGTNALIEVHYADPFDFIEIERDIDNLGNWVIAGRIDDLHLNFIDKNLIPNTNYSYRLRVSRNGVYSNYSHIRSYASPEASSKLFPVNISSESIHSDGIILSWEKGYLHRANTIDGDWIPVTSIEGPRSVTVYPDLESSFFTTLPNSPPHNNSIPNPGVHWTIPLGDGNDIELVWIDPGTFMMGSPEDELKRDRRYEEQYQATLTKGFWIGRYEITQAQWMNFMDSNPSLFKLSDNHPVDSVTWFDSVEFCNRLTEFERSQGRLGPNMKFSLPTAAQWEFSVRERGDATGANYFGSEIDITMSNVRGHTLEGTVKVGQFQPNTLGLFDMYGNVWEWCFDAYERYNIQNNVNPIGLNSRIREIRGGSWRELGIFHRSAWRNAETPLRFDNDLGLRIALQIDIPDQIGPETMVSSHTDNQVVTSDVVTLEGLISDKDNSGISQFFINQTYFLRNQVYDMEKIEFTHELQLEPGENKVTITAYDGSIAANRSSKTLTLIYTPAEGD